MSSVSTFEASRARFVVGLWVTIFSTAGCGAAVPLLHPAHVLPPGKTAFAAGVSDRLMLGAAKRTLDDARQRLPDADVNDDRSRRALLIAVAEGPALAPFASARVGIAGSNEAGLSYSGQALRADVRHAFEWSQYALSAGLGFTRRGFGQSALDLPGTDLSRASSIGVDLPVLFGYRSDADLISAWGGLRASFDHWSGKVTLDPEQPYQLAASRLGLGPVLGLSVGLPPFWVSAELEVDYANVTGTLDRAQNRAEAHTDGWSVRPAGALIAKF